jgi:hypothetical protein
MTDRIAALGEPVAWRIRRGDSDMWGYGESESEADFHGNSGSMRYVKQPLYTAAQARAFADAERVAARSLSALEDWHEDNGCVLWWRLPIDEPPYVGTPNCSDWPGYHTHWQEIDCPSYNEQQDAIRARGQVK